jgi:hypothetical protein
MKVWRRHHDSPPLAAVLWNGGISFGGVIAFIFADLIVLPVLDIYRKYYGWKMMSFVLVTFYTAMVGGPLVIEFLFGAAGWVPQQRSAQIVEAAITLNYATNSEPDFSSARRSSPQPLLPNRRAADAPAHEVVRRVVLPVPQKGPVAPA